MDHTKRNILPKEKHMSGSAGIHNVSQYLYRVGSCIKERQQGDRIVVYRGEPDVYDKPCRPNIFRRDVLNNNRFFEKNLFDTMRQNKLTGEKRYLDNAIDAQHGEFPSRLLDVSYNCLIALYFAVTPYYHNAENSMDHRDGMVYLFFIDEIFSPSASNTNDNYNAIINQDQEWYQNHILFWNNHKFIDHTKLNSRIIAQQGAFILFPGDEPEDLPEYMFCGIQIPKEAKPLIRQELNQLFGIHTGSIYPEIINLVKELSGKSKRLNTEEFTCEHELNHILRQMEKELIYYLDYAIEQKRSSQIHEILVHIERRVDHYRQGLLAFIQYIEENKQACDNILEENVLRQVIEQYNQLVQSFSDEIEEHRIGTFSCKSLQIE